MAKKFWVFNETDGLFAFPHGFFTVDEALEGIACFIERFKRQGYYRTIAGDRLELDFVRLIVQDARGKVYHERGRLPLWYFVCTDGSHGTFGGEEPSHAR